MPNCVYEKSLRYKLKYFASLQIFKNFNKAK